MVEPETLLCRRLSSYRSTIILPSSILVETNILTEDSDVLEMVCNNCVNNVRKHTASLFVSVFALIFVNLVRDWNLNVSDNI